MSTVLQIKDFVFVGQDKPCREVQKDETHPRDDLAKFWVLEFYLQHVMQSTTKKFVIFNGVNFVI